METKTISDPDWEKVSDEVSKFLFKRFLHLGIDDVKLEYFFTKNNGEDTHTVKLTYEVKE